MMAIIARFSNNLYEILQPGAPNQLATPPHTHTHRQTYRHTPHTTFFPLATNGNAQHILPARLHSHKCERVSIRWAPPSWKRAAKRERTLRVWERAWEREGKKGSERPQVSEEGANYCWVVGNYQVMRPYTVKIHLVQTQVLARYVNI